MTPVFGLLGIVVVAFSLAAPKNKQGPLRVNRAFRATHSRREANRFIAAGRVVVNGIVVSNPDDRLAAGDRVLFDGNVVAWEEESLDRHRYVKLNKRAGVVCTTDRRVPNNILDALEGDDEVAVAVSLDRSSDDASSFISGPDGISGNERRIFPIGRLDAESTGLILLTSDGSIVNPLLRPAGSSLGGGTRNGGTRRTKKKKANKAYHVTTSPRATDEQIRRLSSGVEITTLARRDGGMANVTALTLPCVVERHIGDDDDEVSLNENELRFVIEEGRNRQIRKMCGKLGLDVVLLHRVGFAGVSLRGCESPGSWAPLTPEEEIMIGASVAPTRDERRSPEERARRKRKKLDRKLGLR